MKRIVGAVVVAGLLVSLNAQAWAAQESAESQAGAGSVAPKTGRTAQDAARATGFALPAGVRSEEVQFDGAGVRLAGTLFLPKAGAGKRAPAVLILAATPLTPRDGIAVGADGKAVHYTYRDLAAHLAARGYAVLRYDYRCVGASDCQPRSPLASYSDDALKALEYLRARAEVDPRRVVIFGHGDGGFLGAFAAGEGKAAGLVLAAASGRSGDKLLRERAARRLAEQGVPEAERRAYLARLEAMMTRFKQGNIDTAQEKVDQQDEFLTQVVKYSDFVYSWLQDDPLQAMAVLNLPVLIMQGEKDTQMSVRDAQYLEEALKRAENNDVTLRLLPDVDHALKTSKVAASLKADADTARPIDAEFLKTLGEWLDKRMKK
jgi:uncharacterized protein